MNKAGFIFLFVSSLFFSCTQGIELSGPESLVVEFTSTHEAPKGFVYTQKKRAIRFELSKIIRVRSESKTENPYDIVLGRRFLCPVRMAWDSQQDVNVEQALLSLLKNVEDITPPELCQSVDGLWVNDTGYPLVEEIHLKSTIKKLRGRKQNVLTIWLRSLVDEKDSPSLVKIAAVGDIMIGRGSDTILLNKGPLSLFNGTLPILQNTELTVANLEGAVTDRGIKTSKSYNFRFPSKIIPLLKEAGIQYVMPTNNHIWDFGEIGFRDTLKAFKKHGMGYSGAGLNLQEALAPWESTFPGGKVQVFSVGAYPDEQNGFSGTSIIATEKKPGIAWQGADFSAALCEQKNSKDLVCVLVHGGVEWRHKPSQKYKMLYRSFIDNGADAVIGSHPHVLQGFEIYRGKLIVYSLGNFIFPGMGETDGGEDSVIVSMGWDKKTLRYLEITPVKLRNTITDIGTEKQRVAYYTQSVKLQEATAAE